MRKKTHVQFLLLLLAASLLLTACEAVTIAQIKADPSRFGNKTIAVRGTVVNSMGVLSHGGYEIEDGTGRILILSGLGVPSKGSRVVVEGTVFSGATFFGQSIGVAIREIKHHVNN